MANIPPGPGIPGQDNDNTHRFEYDTGDRLRREERPMGQGIDYDYHPDGSLAMRTNALGQRREYGYDDAGRRTLEQHFDVGSQTPSQTVVYTHDPRGLLETYTQTGDTQSAATYTYNARGEKTGETVTYGEGPDAFTRSIGYDPGQAGRPARFVYPDGKWVDYRYDEAGRPAGIDGPGGSIEYRNYQWQHPTRIEMPGAVRTLAYDVLQRPTQIRVQALGTGTWTDPNGAVLMDYGYTYDAAGNITERDTEAGPYSYGYDQLDRLTQAVPPPDHQATVTRPDLLPVEGYEYDPVHNRIHSAHQSGAWQYNANNELLGYGLGQDAVSFEYDDNGHTVLETKGTGEDLGYHYNPAERLSEIKRNGATIAVYHYDPMGRRIRKQANGRVTWFQYADNGPIAEYGGTGTLERTYGWRPQGLWGTDPVFLADVTGSGSTTFWTTHYYHNNHMHTPERLINSDGNQTWAAVAEAFGKTTPAPGNTIDNPLRFPGQYEDAETATHYNYFRDYDPTTGRYVQSDPIGLRGGISTYGYVGGNPLAFIDPLGLKARVCCRKIPFLPAAHCFIEEDHDDIDEDFCGPPCETKKRTIGLQGPSPFGDSSNGGGQTFIDHGFDDPSQSKCGEWTTDCHLSKCLDREYAAYANPSRYSGPRGPNSNTFASTLMSRCGLTPPGRGWPRPGWGQDPAGPLSP